MNEEKVPENRRCDDTQIESRSSADTATTKSQYERCAERARECIDRGVEMDDPFKGSLAATTGHLFLLKAQLDEAVQNRMGDGPPNLEQIQRLIVPIELGLRVARQADRQYQLMHKETESGDR